MVPVDDIWVKVAAAVLTAAAAVVSGVVVVGVVVVGTVVVLVVVVGVAVVVVAAGSVVVAEAGVAVPLILDYASFFWPLYEQKKEKQAPTIGLIRRIIRKLLRGAFLVGQNIIGVAVAILI